MPERWDTVIDTLRSRVAMVPQQQTVTSSNINVVQVCCCDIATIGIIGEIVQFPSCVRHGGVKVTWSIRAKVSAEHGQASVSPFNLRRAKSSKIISSSPSASLRIENRKDQEVVQKPRKNVIAKKPRRVVCKTVRETSNKIISSVYRSRIRSVLYPKVKLAPKLFRVTHVSSWMRFVSSGTSPLSVLCVGLGRAVDGTGSSSSGLGCIRMKGSSATNSLSIRMQ